MRSVAGLFVLSLAACSFALTGPHDPPVAHEHCAPESDAPPLDVAGAVVFLGIASAAFISDATASSGAEGRGLASLFVGAPSAVIGLVYAAAAGDGFYKLAGCKSARTSEWDRRAREAVPDQGSATPVRVDGSASAAERSWQSTHE